MSSRSCATGSVRSCGGSVRLGAALAGGGAHEVVLDALYERKHDKKTVRVLTVIVYVFCVSLAAIMLSLYYVFFWEPKDSQHAQRQVSQTVRRPPTTSPLPTCFMPRTGRSNSTIRNEPPDDAPSTSYEQTGETAHTETETSERSPASTDSNSSSNATAFDSGAPGDDGHDHDHDHRNGTDT